LADPGYSGSGGAVAGAESASSRLLGRNLEAFGGLGRPAQSAAHHIVAGGAEAASEARAVLAEFGVGINHAVNGVFLPRFLTSSNSAGAAVHSVVHTADYYQSVNRILSKANSPEEVLGALGYIRDRLLSGQMPV